MHLPPCQLNGKNLEIFLRSSVGATLVRGWQPHPRKLPKDMHEALEGSELKGIPTK